MAAQMAPPPARIRYSIATESDLLIKLEEIEKPLSGRSRRTNNEPIVKAIHEFEVSKTDLKNNDYFRRVITPGFADTGQSSYQLHEDDPVALKFWLQILHKSLDDSSLDVTISTVWFVLKLADKYDFNPFHADVKKWLTDWLAQNQPETEDAYREILYPCWVFDHAAGFADATKYLVYNFVGHITEKRPDGFFDVRFRLDQRVIQQLNAARGRLRNILHLGCYEPGRVCLKSSSCAYRKHVLWNYFTALENTSAWPIEITGSKKSINDLLSLLRAKINYSDPHPEDKTCTDISHCGQQYQALVNKSVERTQRYFDGLCLDCMNHSKTESMDADYWIHNEPGVQWDVHCRIHHGEPTWYFSFMGRKENMDHFHRHRK
ncbi:hypothetical protein Q7P37_002831 [Cladosporium fusiforme]